MKLPALSSVALCLALGACASVPPTGPRVSAVPSDSPADRHLAADDSACRARAQAVTDREAANGEFGLQRHYDQIYADCMLDKGHHIESPVGPRYGYGPYYGPAYGPYWGPAYYGGWGYGRRW